MDAGYKFKNGKFVKRTEEEARRREAYFKEVKDADCKIQNAEVEKALHQNYTGAGRQVAPHRFIQMRDDLLLAVTPKFPYITVGPFRYQRKIWSRPASAAPAAETGTHPTGRSWFDRRSNINHLSLQL